MTASSATHLRIGFIGAGRLGTALAWALARKGCKVVAAASRSRASAEKLASGAAGCLVVSPQEVVDLADLVFLATPDDAITPLAASVAWPAGRMVSHCSGATEVAALAPAAAQGALTGAFHPVQTFTEPEAAIATLPGCTVSIEAPEPMLGHLRALAELLGCRTIQLPPGARARYHAANGYAAQFVNVLLREASTVWQTFGATEDEAVRALLPLLKGTVVAIERAGVVQGLAGPISRGDVGTVRKHLEALGGLGPDAVGFYCEHARRAVDIAIDKGTLTAAQAAELRALLAPRR